MSYWMTHFILEVRKKNGDPYPPNTLHHIIAGLMRHIKQAGRVIDFFKDSSFTQFRASLDAEMKRLQSEGLGSRKRQAEIITEEEENTLWQKGLLGDKTPQTLLDTMVFYCGLYFALRSGKEHRQLRHSPCQIELVENPGERAFLRYSEDISKNHQGGLKGRKMQPKVVFHHENAENKERCFIRLFKRYRSLCPSDAPEHAFYLQPARSPTESCWYSSKPLGHTPLGKTVSRLCQTAGITGYKTNHSLPVYTSVVLRNNLLWRELVIAVWRGFVPIREHQPPNGKLSLTSSTRQTLYYHHHHLIQQTITCNLPL